MPWAIEQNAGFFSPQAVGPILLTVPVIQTLPTAATIAATGNWTSGLLPGDGYKAISVGATSTQTGAINVQRYIDQAGTVKQGAASTTALAGGSPAVLNITDGLPYASFTISITNTGGSAATISGFAALLAAS